MNCYEQAMILAYDQIRSMEDIELQSKLGIKL